MKKYIIWAALLSMIFLTSCAQDDPQPANDSLTVTYNVTALTGQCVAPGLMAGAIVDQDDKLDLWTAFSPCGSGPQQIASNSVILVAGDVLQIKVAANGSFDKTLRYKISISTSSINGISGTWVSWDSVDYKGIAWTVE